MDAVDVYIPTLDSSNIDAIEKDRADIEALEDLAIQMESGNFTADIAFEADRIAPASGILGAYYDNQLQKDRLRVGNEAILATIWDTVLKMMAKIREMIKNAIQWFVNLFNRKGFKGSKKQVESIQKIMDDRELARAIDEGLAEAKGKNLGKEDYFPNNEASTVIGIFSSFQAGLSDMEIDFLSSGTRYKQMRNAVSDFTGAHLSEFLRDYEKDLFKWGQDGLEKSIHTGNGEDAIQSFITDQMKKHRAMQEQYDRPIRIIREMTDQYLKPPEPVHRERLKIFMREPSKLFPHLEHLWKEIHFERISEEDRKILHTLEEVEKNHEHLVTKFQAYAKANQKPWGPEEEMLKNITKVHQESMVLIGKLVRVAGHIKTASATAYTASIKSLTYLIRVLNEISKLPNVNRDKVMKSIDIISDRRRALIDVAKIAD